MSLTVLKVELPKQYDRYIATLTKIYKAESNHEYEKILVNADIMISVGCYFNAFGEPYGRALYFFLPETIFINIFPKISEIADRIKEDINRELHNVYEEFDVVYIEMKIIEGTNWRKDSNQLQPNTRRVDQETQDHIWGVDNFFRIFITHLSEDKGKAMEIKESLKEFGVSCFVAHVDISPTKEWQNEIENALNTMDTLVALMTEKFRGSKWTDQEIGFALGRGIPVIPVSMGCTPYGLIGKIQAISCDWMEIYIKIASVLISDQRTASKMIDAYIYAMRECSSYEQANKLSNVLPNITSISEAQVQDIINIYNRNIDIKGSWGFNGTKDDYGKGKGLLPILIKYSGTKYKIDWNNNIIPA